MIRFLLIGFIATFGFNTLFFNPNADASAIRHTVGSPQRHVIEAQLAAALYRYPSKEVTAAIQKMREVHTPLMLREVSGWNQPDAKLLRTRPDRYDGSSFVQFLAKDPDIEVMVPGTKGKSGEQRCQECAQFVTQRLESPGKFPLEDHAFLMRLLADFTVRHLDRKTLNYLKGLDDVEGAYAAIVKSQKHFDAVTPLLDVTDQLRTKRRPPGKASNQVGFTSLKETGVEPLPQAQQSGADFWSMENLGNAINQQRELLAKQVFWENASKKTYSDILHELTQLEKAMDLQVPLTASLSRTSAARNSLALGTLEDSALQHAYGLYLGGFMITHRHHTLHEVATVFQKQGLELSYDMTDDSYQWLKSRLTGQQREQVARYQRTVEAGN